MVRDDIVRKRLIRWWTSDNSRNGLFPWRSREISPYRAIVTEVLLQRTRAESVSRVYDLFFKRFPDPASLASADEALVKETIYGLGLLWRADKLRALGRSLLNGVPETMEALLELPGVGPYAAGAYLSLHRGKRAVIPDANMARVLGRIFGFDVTPETRKKRPFLDFCERITPKRKFREFNYAILDFGRTICKPGKPLSTECFLNDICHHAVIKKKDMIHDSV